MTTRMQSGSIAAVPPPSAAGRVKRVSELPLGFLPAFEAAGRLGSFAAAAAELHVTPSAVSQQIRALEDALGVSLFARTHRSAELTDAGRAHLAGLKSLQTLSLAGTAVTDAGLAHLAGLSSLSFLDLADTRVTDAGVKHLAGLGALTASTATYIPPVTAVIIGAIFLHEPVLPTTIVAIVLILGAAVVTQIPPRSKTGTASP